MRGHLQQRSPDTWRLKVYVGRSADGKRRYLERTVHGSRREAERELARLIVEVDEGRHVASAPMTMGELLDRWLDLKAMTVEANTANGYRWIVERYVRPTFGDRKVASIRTLELDHWCQHLRTGGGIGRPAAVGPDRAAVPHRHAPVARAGPQSEASSPATRPSTPRHPPLAAPRSSRPRSSTCTTSSRRRSSSTRTSASTCGCWLSPAAGVARRARSGGRTSTGTRPRSPSAARSPRSTSRGSRRTPRPTRPAGSPSTRQPGSCSGSSTSGPGTGARGRCRSGG